MNFPCVARLGERFPNTIKKLLSAKAALSQPWVDPNPISQRSELGGKGRGERDNWYKQWAVIAFEPLSQELHPLLN